MSGLLEQFHRNLGIRHPFEGLASRVSYHPSLEKEESARMDRDGFPQGSYTRACTRDRESYVLEA